MSTNTAVILSEEEVEARKARMHRLKQEYAKHRGESHPDKAPLHPDALDAEFPPHGAQAKSEAEQRKRPTPREQEVLDVAARLYKPGDVAWPSKLASELGWPPVRASVAITGLRGKGIWPYAPAQNQERPKQRPRAVPPPAKAAGPDLREPAPEPIRNTDPKADAELLVIQRVLAQFARLPDVASQGRVLRYLADRLDREIVQAERGGAP